MKSISLQNLPILPNRETPNRKSNMKSTFVP